MRRGVECHEAVSAQGLNVPFRVRRMVRRGLYGAIVAAAFLATYWKGPHSGEPPKVAVAGLDAAVVMIDDSVCGATRT